MKIVAPGSAMHMTASAPLSLGADHQRIQFSALLGRTSVDQAGGSSRAYGFAALGMFGLGRAVPGEDQDGGNRVAADRAMRQGVTDPAPIGPSELLRQHHVQDEPAAHARQSARSQVAPIICRQGDVAPEALPELQAMEYLAPEPPGAEDGGGTALPLRQRSQPRPAPVQLILTGPDDAIQIVMRSSEDSAEARLRQRRLVESVASEFGVTLASVHINGFDTTHSFASMKGAVHVPRTR